MASLVKHNNIAIHKIGQSYVFKTSNTINAIL